MPQEDVRDNLKEVVQIDAEKIQSHLGRVLGGTAEEALNGLLDAEADQFCEARRYDWSGERRRSSFVGLSIASA